MPNRIIKEGICTSENIDSLSLEGETFFYRLMVKCDDYGRFDARPSVLRAACFPLRLRKVSENRVAKLLQELIRAELVETYSVADHPYLHIVKWDSHQQIRAKHSKFPHPAEDDSKQPDLNSSDVNGNHLQSDAPVIQSNTESESERESESNNGAYAPPVVAANPDKALSAGQKFFLNQFGAVRFKTIAQREAVLQLEKNYGTDLLKECTVWAAKKGMTVGDAITSIETAIGVWGQGKGRRNGKGPPVSEPKGYAAIREFLAEQDRGDSPRNH